MKPKQEMTSYLNAANEGSANQLSACFLNVSPLSKRRLRALSQMDVSALDQGSCLDVGGAAGGGSSEPSSGERERPLWSQQPHCGCRRAERGVPAGCYEALLASAK